VGRAVRVRRRRRRQLRRGVVVRRGIPRDSQTRILGRHVREPWEPWFFVHEPEKGHAAHDDDGDADRRAGSRAREDARVRLPRARRLVRRIGGSGEGRRVRDVRGVSAGVRDVHRRGRVARGGWRVARGVPRRRPRIVPRPRRTGGDGGGVLARLLDGARRRGFFFRKRGRKRGRKG